ncbi:TPR domain protein [Aphelenchoides avenae]|nr:TPR domain protein [Aphelenchus avenae]
MKGERFLDVADYVGPVEVADIAGKGKGLVATEDVTKGTLLMVSKAFAMSYPDEYAPMVSGFNRVAGTRQSKPDTLNVVKAILTLERNPHRAREVYALYAGTFSRVEVLPEGIVDTGRIEQALIYNSFRSQDTFNMQDEEEATEMQPSGLWIKPSYFNHACLANAYRTFYADVMVVFAIADIPKGAEVTLSYIDATLPYTKRSQLLEGYGFVCQCRLCTLDRADEQQLEREKIYREFEGMAMKDALDLSRTKVFLERMRKTYRNRKELRTQMSILPYALGSMYEAQGELNEAAQCFRECLDCYGEELRHQRGVPIMLRIAMCYKQLGKHREAKKFADAALALNRTRMGGDARLLQKIFDQAREIF